VTDDKFAWSPGDIEWVTEGDKKKAQQRQLAKLKSIDQQIRDKAQNQDDGNSAA